MTGTRFFFREPILRLLILGFLFVAALGLRLYRINQPPMEFDPPRQYHGALLARGFYEWLLSGNLRPVPPDGIIEPPILELLASCAYLLSGGEHLWIPRLLSALFWMGGGIFLYLIAKKIVSPTAAVFSVAFYLFVPYGVLASRAVMPDPLMIMLLIVSIFTILRYHEQPTTLRLIVTIVASSVAIFVKPGICLFQVFGPFISLAIYRQGVRRSLINPHLLMFVSLSILPSGLYYLYGTILAGFLRGQVSQKVVPQLLLKASFWEGWLVQVWFIFGFVALAGAFLGVLLLRKGWARALMIGLWGGYFLFGLTFTDNIYTIPYYSLQLIPVVALSLGPVADSVMKRLNRTADSNHLGGVGLRNYGKAIVFALCISALALSAVEQRQTISEIAQQDRRASIYAHYVATFEEIGKIVNHSRHTLVLFDGPQTLKNPDPDYGYALMYHGRLSGRTWPYPVRSVFKQAGGPQVATQELIPEERLDKYSKKRSPEYFVISKSWWKREELRDLRAFLTRNFPMITQNDSYVVFDLRKRT